MAESYGIKVGSNLNTNTDLQLNLTSKFSSKKLYKWGNAQITTNGSGEGSVEITHDLGYVPIVSVFRKFTAQYPFLAATTYSNAFCPLDLGNPYVQDGDFYFLTDDSKITISTYPAIGGIGFVGTSPNTTYTFRYMIFVDLSEVFSTASDISLTGDYGFKISKPGKNVLTGEEYEMAYSSKYKALQYYENHIVGPTNLTLPGMWASPYDDYEEEAVYVDYNHNLGYAPYFLAFSTPPDSASTSIYETPLTIGHGAGIAPDGFEAVTAWSDSSRVRVTFHRWSSSVYGDDYGNIFAAKTISVRAIIFAEDLAGAGSS